MATSGQLVSELAKLLGIAENAVVTPWRMLREAGVVTKGARGVNASHVSAQDAAQALTAILSGGIPLKGVREAWGEFASLRARNSDRQTGFGGPKWEAENLPFPKLRALPEQHLLTDALAALIEHAGEPEGAAFLDAHKLTVLFSGPLPFARLTIGSRAIYETVRYGLEEAALARDVVDEFFRGDLHQQRVVTHQTIVGLGCLVASAPAARDVA